MARRVDSMRLVLTCEHATNALPAMARTAFSTREARRALATHRGWDPGARALASWLASRLRVPLIEGRVSRLAIDLNRSLHHPNLLSEWSRKLPDAQIRMLRGLHQAHWDAVRKVLREAHGPRRPVLHVAVHSFVPALGGTVRQTDIGILYDPRRSLERRMAAQLVGHLRSSGPQRVHKNAPYRGVSDGLPTALRREWPADLYAGIELEVNQRLLVPRRAVDLEARIVAAIRAALRPSDGLARERS